MAYDPSIFNISPYYDDFDPDNKFLRILFKPGYAVQARELTQLQSVLQNQISKIGDHLFKDGSRIVGAPITVRNSNFLGLNTGTGTPFSGFATTDWDSLVGGTVYFGATASGTIAHVLPPETDDKAFIVFDYTNGYSSLIPSNGAAPYTNGVTLGITAADGTAYSPFVPKGATYNGLCKLVTVGDGIFYVDGAFVVNQEQSFTPYYVASDQRDLSGTVGGVTFAGIDKKVGFTITRDTVTSAEDETLLDPSFGSPNYKAPGGDRFVINLALDQIGATETQDDFIELLRFEDGKVTKKIDKVVYGDISETFARRTYDESGSYVVKPFDISVRESSTSSENLDVVIGPGKAYVMGVEVETKYPTILGISKARTGTTAAARFNFNVGNVVYGASLDRNSTANSNMGQTFYGFLNTMNGGSSVIRFRNASNAIIGEAKLHGAIPTGLSAWAGHVGIGVTQGIYVTGPSYYNLYLYGICSGSVIAGASSAVVYGFTGGSNAVQGGVTFAVFTPGYSPNFTLGTTFAPIGGSASSDSCLVYEILPTQSVKEFDSVVFYGKAATKSSALWASSGAVANWIGMTGATLQFGPSDIDLPAIPSTSNFSLVWSNSLSGAPTTDASITSKYHVVSGGGRTAGLALSLGNLDSGGIASASVSVQNTNNIQLNIRGFHPGFTAPVRVIAPYKYSILSANLNNYTNVSGLCRTKVLTTYENQPAATYRLSNINGRLGFTLPSYDIYSATKVWREGNDITNDFELDDGQREGFYDYGAFIVKKSKEGTSIAGSGGLAYQTGTNISGVTFAYTYFTHGGYSFGPFLGKHSYWATTSVGMTYGEIPLFTNPRTGRTVSLANCIDFRHTGTTFDAIVAKPYGIFEGFDVNQATGATWNNYLPRIDRISLKINPSDLSTSFAIDSGTPDLAPESPPETENSLTLATVTLPAYTHSATDVIVQRNDVRRYTMADINAIEKRVDNVESFAKLTASEAELDSNSIKLAIDGYSALGGTLGASTSVFSVTSEPVKTSIFTDDFFGHAGGDVSDSNHRCSVDYEYGELRPLFLHNFSSVTPTAGSTTGQTVQVSPDGLITFSYSTTTPLVDSSGYNKSIKINPSGTVNWLGFIDISKQYETQFDTSIRPVVYSNNLSENDNWIGSNANATKGFGTHWNDWEYLWGGTQIRTDQKDDIQKRTLEAPRTNNVSTAIPNINSGNEKTAVSRGVPSIEEKVGTLINSNRLVGRNRYKTLDNRIVDRTVVPYVPASANIGVTAYGLRPNSTGLGLYIDGTLVKSGLTTNTNGTLGVTFAFTLGSNLSGEKSIRITDSVDVENATQAADKVFYCTGTVNQRTDGVYSTRNPEYRRQTVTSEGIIKDPFNREVSYDNIQDTIKNNSWVDPLCQTFIVDKKAYPEGVFAKSVTLYFAEKDDTLPVTIQLRPTISGYPSPSVSFPFSTVTLLPSEINTGLVGTSTTPVGTTFDFKSPVYLEPGEYAIAVMTNSKKYELRASDSGVNLTNSGRSNSPFVGTLYQPQSIGAAAQDLSTDIAFGVNICEFPNNSSSGTVSYSNILDVGNCQVVKMSAPVIIPQECSHRIQVGSNTVYNGQNTYLQTVSTTTENLVFTLNKPSNKSYISPAIDAGLFFGYGAEMLVTTASNPNTFGTATSSYVTKAITLPEDLVSNGVFATSEICCPFDSAVRAWVRWSDRGENDLFNKPWVQMTAIAGFGSPKFPFNSTPSFVRSGDASRSDYDFRHTEWAWFGSSTASTVRSYQVLLMFTTQNSGANKTYAVLPAVRNFRMCSFRSV